MSNDKVPSEAPVEDSGNEAASSEDSWRTRNDSFAVEIAQMVPTPEDDPDYIPIEQAISPEV